MYVYTHTHTMEYHSAIKNEEILSFVTTWMNLEGIMLNEISQTEKDKYYMILLIHGIFKKHNKTKNTSEKKRSDL